MLKHQLTALLEKKKKSKTVIIDDDPLGLKNYSGFITKDIA